MATILRVHSVGSQLHLHASDGSITTAYPTPAKTWIVGHTTPPDPDPDPEPGTGGWHHPLGPAWPKNTWTSYTGEPSHDAGACDFGTGYGGEEPLYAPCDGTITFAGWLGDGSGNNIVVKVAGEDRWIAMLHLNWITVSVGDTVTGGQRIGTTGWTGNVVPVGPGGAHLHLEVRTQPQWGAWVACAPYFASKGVTL